MREHPGLSFLCPTYGRFPNYGHLLSECVDAFQRQEYAGPMELVILNDCPQQELVCDVPGVRVINAAKRFTDLGTKYNALVEAARYDILLPAEDDDVSLPGRAMQAAWLLSGGFDWFNPQKSFFWDGTTLHVHHPHGVCHNASAYTRTAWAKVSGYPPTSSGTDTIMDARLKALGNGALPLNDDPVDWTYCYRWGMSDIHLSAHHPHEARVWADHGKKPVIPGIFHIEPRSIRPYLDRIAEAISRNLAECH